MAEYFHRFLDKENAQLYFEKLHIRTRA